MNEMIAVNDIYASIQGEGSMAGIPMVILRLQGCDVGCPWCDTKETWAVAAPGQEPTKAGHLEPILGKSALWTRISVDKLVDYIDVNFHAIKWVMLTGGEPAMQELKPLVEALHAIGRKVAIETSGTELGHIDAGCDWVCISPKIRQPKPILPKAIEQADEIKTVIGKTDDIYLLEEFLAKWKPKPGCIISLQPVSQSRPATELCIKHATLKNWRVSLQMHKYLDLP
jgi:7-carboxy-7-deazaguanine synthase